MSQIKVGINGLGRIGRYFLRLSTTSSNAVQVTAVNSTGSIESAAHLIQYDSVHGRFQKEVHTESNQLKIDGHTIQYSQQKNPENILWKDVDVVLESTGIFKTKQDLQKHFCPSVNKIVVAAPAEGADLTIVYGVNHTDYQADIHHIVSNASCTTNALAPLVQLLHQYFELKKGFMTTVHAYTLDQRLLDSTHKDLRRARSAGLSMIPTTTGATSAIEKILPSLKGRLQGVSIRVPTANVSLIELVAQCQKPMSLTSVHQAFEKESQSQLKGVLAMENKPLVSQDFLGSSYSTILDTQLTKVSDPDSVQLFSWYDNEAGFCYRLMDVIQWIHS